MADGNVALVLAMLTSVVKEIRSKHRADRLPLKMPMAKRQPKAPLAPVVLTPPTLKNEEENTSARGGQAKKRAAVGEAYRPHQKEDMYTLLFSPPWFLSSGVK